MRKGIILIIVLTMVVVISLLSLVSLSLMTQQSHVSEHKIRRARVLYAAQAGLVDAQDSLRRNAVATPTPGNPTVYSINVGAGITGYPSTGLQVDITITAKGDAGCPNTSPSNYCIAVNVVQPNI